MITRTFHLDKDNQNIWLNVEELAVEFHATLEELKGWYAFCRASAPAHITTTLIPKEEERFWRTWAKELGLQ